MLPGLEMIAACPDLAVPAQVMQHVAAVESSHNPYAIGVVGGRLVRQPRNLAEAVSTAQMLEQQGYNFSVGLVQVNRHNLARQGLADYAQAFAVCPNVQAGARILAECRQRAGNDWGKAFSCYYSGNFSTGYRDGYVQKVFASLARDAQALALAGLDRGSQAAIVAAGGDSARLARRIGAESVRTADALLAGALLPRRQQAVAPVAGEPVLPAQVPAVAPADVVQPLQVSVHGRPVAQAAVQSAAPVVPTMPVANAAAMAPPSMPARDSALVF